MSRHRLRLTVTGTRGALIRALSMVERRGFTLGEIHSSRAAADGVGEIAVWVESSGRSVDCLCRQLAKLVEVRSVREG